MTPPFGMADRHAHQHENEHPISIDQLTASTFSLHCPANSEAAIEFRLKLTILSSALRAREAKLITPAQTCEVLNMLLQGDLSKAAHLMDSLIMSYAVESDCEKDEK
jgi:hypothetical protein